MKREDIIACIRHDLYAITRDVNEVAANVICHASDGPDWLSVAALLVSDTPWPTVARPSVRAAIGAALSLADGQVDEAAGTLAQLCVLSTPEWAAMTFAQVSR